MNKKSVSKVDELLKDFLYPDLPPTTPAPKFMVTTTGNSDETDLFINGVRQSGIEHVNYNISTNETQLNYTQNFLVNNGKQLSRMHVTITNPQLAVMHPAFLRQVDNELVADFTKTENIALENIFNTANPEKKQYAIPSTESDIPYREKNGLPDEKPLQKEELIVTDEDEPVKDPSVKFDPKNDTPV